MEQVKPSYFWTMFISEQNLINNLRETSPTIIQPLLTFKPLLLLLSWSNCSTEMFDESIELFSILNYSKVKYAYLYCFWPVMNTGRYFLDS